MKRHPQHDYTSPGGYFVTFVTADRKPNLGTIQGDQIDLSPAGHIVNETWNWLPSNYSNLRLDAFQIMPDHVHCILQFVDLIFVEGDEKKAGDLSNVMQAFKAITSRKIRKSPGLTQVEVWQKGFQDRIIRNEGELDKFRDYIQTNILRVNLKNRE